MLVFIRVLKEIGVEERFLVHHFAPKVDHRRRSPRMPAGQVSRQSKCCHYRVWISANLERRESSLELCGGICTMGPFAPAGRKSTGRPSIPVRPSPLPLEGFLAS